MGRLIHVSGAGKTDQRPIALSYSGQLAHAPRIVIGDLPTQFRALHEAGFAIKQGSVTAKFKEYKCELSLIKSKKADLAKKFRENNTTSMVTKKDPLLDQIVELNEQIAEIEVKIKKLAPLFQ